MWGRRGAPRVRVLSYNTSLWLRAGRRFSLCFGRPVRSVRDATSCCAEGKFRACCPFLPLLGREACRGVRRMGVLLPHWVACCPGLRGVVRFSGLLHGASAVCACAKT